MDTLLLKLSDKLYLRDPQKSAMGQTIVSKSIELMDKTGFEHFTFRKLAEEMNSTEATIYRYFGNKQRLLHYLIDWYWTLINFNIDCSTINIIKPEEKLKICLQLLSGARKISMMADVNEAALRRVIISELDKTYLTKTVDKDYKEGLLAPFNEVCQKISDFVREINPRYAFPHSLISTAIHASNHQLYYTKHLPKLSDLKDDSKNLNERLYKFLEGFVFNAIKK